MYKTGSKDTIIRKKLGDLFVGFTGLGLSVGLLMILFLLGLIVKEGLSVFWPKRVLEVLLVEEGSLTLSNKNNLNSHLAGELIKKQQKRIISSVQEKENSLKRKMEWQLYLGNRDVYGASFKYIDQDRVIEQRFPKDIIKIERMEYGYAIGYPIVLQLSNNQKTIPVQDSRFDATLQRLLKTVDSRRQEIKRIEKFEIGSINKALTQLDIQLHSIKRRPKQEDSMTMYTEEIKLIREERSALNKKYKDLEARAKTLRKRQQEDTLIYTLSSGQEIQLTVGNMLDYYYPNRLTFLQRVQRFLGHIWQFLSHDPREANTEGGIFPAIFGTFVMTVLMSLLVTPLGVLAAIYLHEYAKQGVVLRTVRIAINNLAGVPSIVFGVFGLGFFVYGLGSNIDKWFFPDHPGPVFGTGGILWASLTLALLTIPVMIIAAEEALSTVPREMREGSLALGASKWQTIQKVVLPSSAPGILTGVILAMARGAGEVAPLMLVGVVKLAPELPLNLSFPFVHFDQKFMHLGFYIYDLGFQSPDSEAAKPMVFATTLVLIVLVVILNITAIIIRERLHRRYVQHTF